MCMGQGNGCQTYDCCYYRNGIVIRRSRCGAAAFNATAPSQAVTSIYCSQLRVVADFDIACHVIRSPNESQSANSPMPIILGGDGSRTSGRVPHQRLLMFQQLCWLESVFQFPSQTLLSWELEEPDRQPPPGTGVCNSSHWHWLRSWRGRPTSRYLHFHPWPLVLRKSNSIHCRSPGLQSH